MTYKVHRVDIYKHESKMHYNIEYLSKTQFLFKSYMETYFAYDISTDIFTEHALISSLNCRPVKKYSAGLEFSVVLEQSRSLHWDSTVDNYQTTHQRSITTCLNIIKPAE